MGLCWTAERQHGRSTRSGKCVLFQLLAILYPRYSAGVRSHIQCMSPDVPRSTKPFTSHRFGQILVNIFLLCEILRMPLIQYGRYVYKLMPMSWRKWKKCLLSNTCKIHELVYVQTYDWKMLRVCPSINRYQDYYKWRQLWYRGSRA